MGRHRSAADVMHVGQLDLGHLPSDNVFVAHPELPGVRLRLGDGGPVIAYVLILAGDLAVVASVALRISISLLLPCSPTSLRQDSVQTQPDALS